MGLGVLASAKGYCWKAGLVLIVYKIDLGGTITDTGLREDVAMVSITVAGEGCVQLALPLDRKLWRF